MGVGIFLLPPSYLLYVFSIVVAIIMLVMVVKRKATCKQKRDVIVNGNPYCNNTVVVLQELEMLEQGVGADYNNAHSSNQSEDKDEDEDFDVDYNPYEVVDRKVLGKNTTPAPKVSSTPACATMVDPVYAVVDKSKKKGAKKKTEDEPNVINKDNLYAMPMAKAVRITDKGGVVVSGGVEEGEHYDDVVEQTCKANADSITR